MFFNSPPEESVVSDTLVAEVNRTDLHSLEVPDVFETEGSFVVELRNHGEATHVHLHLDDALSSVATLDATNHYVGSESSRPVRIHVEADDEPVRGTLKVATAYGSQTHYIDVTIDPTPERNVEVDPSLSEPGADRPTANDSSGLMESPSTASMLPAVVFGMVAILLAVGAVVSPDGINVVLGVLAVVAAGLGAAYLAIR